jgi:DNA-binding NarL/FixJ family response regulator
MLNDLSSRHQREIALLVATGATKEIARELTICAKTAKNISTTVFNKTGMRGRIEPAVEIVCAGLEAH